MTPQIVDQTTTDSPGGYVEYGKVTERRSDRYDVTVRAPAPTGIGAEIRLNGVPMKGVLSYSVDVGLREPTRVHVTFLANSVNEIGSESA
jgi:hypothetical protein